MPHSKIASEVKYLSKERPTRYRYKEGLVEHKGKLYEERLGFRGNKVVEVALVKPKRKKR